MKLITYILAFVMILIIGCKKDEPTNNDNQGPSDCTLLAEAPLSMSYKYTYLNGKLSKITYKYDRFENYEEFIRDGNSQVIRIENKSNSGLALDKVEFTYQDGKVIQAKKSLYDSLSGKYNLYSTCEYQYASKKYPVRINVSDASGKKDGFYVYQFDQRDNLTKVEYYTYETGSPYLLFFNEMKYDDKKSPYDKFFMPFNPYHDHMPHWSVNNVVYMNNHNGVAMNFQYTYNNLGYPTTITLAGLLKKDYTYDCK